MSGGDIPGLMLMAFSAVMDGVHEQLAARGFDDVRPAHGFVFQFLSHRRDGATAVEVAAHLGVTKQAATQMLGYLEARGYVRRERHPTDRRARPVALTERGWACIAAVVEEWRVAERRWAELIGEDGVARLRKDLGAIVADTGAGAVGLRPVW